MNEWLHQELPPQQMRLTPGHSDHVRLGSSESGTWRVGIRWTLPDDTRFMPGCFDGEVGRLVSVVYPPFIDADMILVSYTLQAGGRHCDFVLEEP